MLPDIIGGYLFTVICAALSGLRYIKNGEKEIVKSLDKIHKAAFEEKKKSLADWQKAEVKL